jgi:hypothetical protein
VSANGRLSDDELSNADGGMQLANVTARAWENMADACETETGLSLSIVRPAGAYRSYFVQGDMKQNPGRWNLNPASSVSLAGPGYSSHGLGRAVDISSFSGARKAWVLANAGRFGFSRTFGEADPNHFGHDGVTTGPASSGATLTPAGTNKTPLEDTLSAAEVADIKKHIDTRAAEIDAQLDALRATQLAHQNLFVEEINTVGTGRVPGGLRGLIVNGIAVSQVNQDLLARENGGGIRSMVSTVIGLLQQVVKKLGA